MNLIDILIQITLRIFYEIQSRLPNNQGQCGIRINSQENEQFDITWMKCYLLNQSTSSRNKKGKFFVPFIEALSNICVNQIYNGNFIRLPSVNFLLQIIVSEFSTIECDNSRQKTCKVDVSYNTNRKHVSKGLLI